MSTTMAIEDHKQKTGPTTGTDFSIEPVQDLFIVGGGINGCGIAADASERGLSVVLCEQADLASATSSASSKLIHGGLRYLEHYEFRLVRESLAEREVLMQKAPHLIQPQRFIVPHSPQLRPAWMIRLGLFLYDHLSTRNRLPASRKLRLLPEDNPLHPRFSTGFEYYDCKVDDARLVIENALAAQKAGARILVRTPCVWAQQHQGLWHITTQRGNTEQHFRSKALINATGPWAQSFIEQRLSRPSPRKLRLIRGSHVAVRSLYQGDQAYLLQNEDERVVFVIPFGKGHTLIGTTDQEYEGNPSQVHITPEEETYLLDVVARHFRAPLSADDIVWRYAGVRPLCDDESTSPSAITRDYTLELQTGNPPDSAPLLSVFGGKLTTYRRLAAAAVDRLKPFFDPLPDCHTAYHPLPGGDFSESSFETWYQQQQKRYSNLAPDLLFRLARAYGARLPLLLDGCQTTKQLGHHFGCGLYQAEVDFLCQQEWAHCADDILWRRSKLGLAFTESQTADLSRYLTQHHGFFST